MEAAVAAVAEITNIEAKAAPVAAAAEAEAPCCSTAMLVMSIV